MRAEDHLKLFKACPLPYAFQEAAEAEYNQQLLKSEGVAEMVKFSEWATSMVHVPKADGTPWSCGDYAINVK